MSRYSQSKSDMSVDSPRNASGMLESALGSSQVYVRRHQDSFGKNYFALTTVQGEMLATFHAQKEALDAIRECQLSTVTLH